MQIQRIEHFSVTVRFDPVELLRLTQALDIAKRADLKHLGFARDDETATEWFEQTAQAFGAAAYASELTDSVPRNERPSGCIADFIARRGRLDENIWGAAWKDKSPAAS